MIYIVFCIVVSRIVIGLITEVHLLVKNPKQPNLNKTSGIVGIILYVLTITYFLYKVYPVLQFIK